jgi:hypothetical protein
MMLLGLTETPPDAVEIRFGGLGAALRFFLEDVKDVDVISNGCRVNGSEDGVA